MCFRVWGTARYDYSKLTMNRWLAQLLLIASGEHFKVETRQFEGVSLVKWSHPRICLEIHVIFVCLIVFKHLSFHEYYTILGGKVGGSHALQI